MYWIKAKVKPRKGTNEYDQYGGAYVNFFVDFIDIDSCFILAEHHIEDETWEIEELDQEYWRIDSKDQLEDGQKEQFDEARLTGYSIVFHCFPKE